MIAVAGDFSRLGSEANVINATIFIFYSLQRTYPNNSSYIRFLYAISSLFLPDPCLLAGPEPESAQRFARIPEPAPSRSAHPRTHMATVLETRLHQAQTRRTCR